jgi:putative transposase
LLCIVQQVTSRPTISLRLEFAGLREDVAHIRTTFQLSERRACGLVCIAVSTFRYQRADSDERLRQQLIDLAREKPRYGYRRLHVLLAREGEVVNHKRVWRVYRQAGLSVKRRKRKRLVRVGRPLETATQANEEWAIDFASDALATGRAIRVFSVVDACTRQCLALEADNSFASRRVTRVLEQAPHSVRQRAGTDLASFSRVECRAKDRTAAHSAGPADAEREWKASTASCGTNV